MNSVTRALIPPIDPTVSRPLWSVMIPAYNCRAYIKETLESALLQDPGSDHMQIEVIDDYSSEDIKEIVDEVGKGRIGYYRQIENVGHTKNFETCLRRSTGHYVHLLHGDDFVHNGFYTNMEKLIKSDESIGAAFCQNFSVNNQNQILSVSPLIHQTPGIITNFLNEIARYQKIFTPSIVVKRAVYETLGGFDERLKWCEDWEMWSRIASTYQIAYLPLALASYRVHNNSNTAKYTQSAEKIEDLARGVDIINEYLPENKKSEFKKWSKNYYAEAWAMGDAAIALQNGNKSLAKQYLKQVFKMANRPVVYIQAIKLWLKTY